MTDKQEIVIFLHGPSMDNEYHIHSSDMISTFGFKTQSFYLTHNTHRFAFIMPADQNAVISEISDGKTDRLQPYWAENWPSASVVFPFMMEQHIPNNLCIGELGCGLGVIASCLSTRHIFTVATDISWNGCRFASYNITNNHGIQRIVCADWRNPPFKPVFDRIIASDVLYEERWGPVILDCIQYLLVPGGFAWIADPCRRYWEAFKHKAVEYGFVLRHIHTQTIAHSGTTVEIIELRRAADPPIN